MNQVEVLWQDEREGRLEINGHSIPLFKYPTGKLLKGARQQYWWTVQVANDWNISNRFLIQAGSINVLVKKVEEHPHKLVKG